MTPVYNKKVQLLMSFIRCPICGMLSTLFLESHKKYIRPNKKNISNLIFITCEACNSKYRIFKNSIRSISYRDLAIVNLINLRDLDKRNACPLCYRYLERARKTLCSQCECFYSDEGSVSHDENFVYYLKWKTKTIEKTLDVCGISI